MSFEVVTLAGAGAKEWSWWWWCPGAGGGGKLGLLLATKAENGPYDATCCEHPRTNTLTSKCHHGIEEVI